MQYTRDRQYIGLAETASSGSSCLRRHYGALIVKNDMVQSLACNESARGMIKCDKRGTCVRQELNIPPGERYELCEAVHAEQNAIIKATPFEMEGATIYIAGYNADGSIASGKPCKLCERMIRNAKIRRIVYKTGDTIIVWTINR